VVKPRWGARTSPNTGGETKMSNVDPIKHWWWNQEEQHGHHQSLVVKLSWATRTPPNTGGEITHYFDASLCSVYFGRIDICCFINLGYLVKSSPKQCLVGSVLLILVSPLVFGGVRVAHIGFTTSVWWGDTGGETKMSNTDPTKHWWWN
jgi:hypothetical protein